MAMGQRLLEGQVALVTGAGQGARARFRRDARSAGLFRRPARHARAWPGRVWRRHHADRNGARGRRAVQRRHAPRARRPDADGRRRAGDQADRRGVRPDRCPGAQRRRRHRSGGRQAGPQRRHHGEARGRARGPRPQPALDHLRLPGHGAADDAAPARADRHDRVPPARMAAGTAVRSMPRPRRRRSSTRAAWQHSCGRTMSPPTASRPAARARAASSTPGRWTPRGWSKAVRWRASRWWTRWRARWRCSPAQPAISSPGRCCAWTAAASAGRLERRKGRGFAPATPPEGAALWTPAKGGALGTLHLEWSDGRGVVPVLSSDRSV